MHIFLCFTEICIPFLVLEDLHPRVCILIKWIRLYRRMKRERTEIGEYRFWVSHLLCSVCLSCAEYSHRICICSSLRTYHLHLVAASRMVIIHLMCDETSILPCPYRIRSSIVCHPPSSYNLHRRIHKY